MAKNNTTRQPRATIIIPVFNQCAYTQRCLKALAATTGHIGCEIIVIDNGCSDGSGQFLQSARQQYSNLTIISNPANRGFAVASNQGAQKARAPYLVFLNNDTIPQPHWLDALLETAAANPTVAAVGSKLLYPDRRIQHAGVVFVADPKNENFPSIANIYYRQPASYALANHVHRYQVLTAACLLVRKTMFNAVNGFDERFWNCYEDVDLCLKIGENDWPIVYQPQSVVTHYESASGAERFSRLDDNIRLLHEKWAGKVKADFVWDGKTAFLPAPACNFMDRARVWPTQFPPSIASYLLLRMAAAVPVDRGHRYLREALAMLQQVKHPGPLLQYRIASIYQQLGVYADAGARFRALLRRPITDSMRAGAWFHLGEMAALQKETLRARHCFRACLTSAPDHRQAALCLAAIPSRTRRRKGAP